MEGFFSCLQENGQHPFQKFQTWIQNSRFWPLGKVFDELLKCPVLLDLDFLGQVAAHRAVVFLQMLKGIRVYAFVSTVHHVVVGSWHSERCVDIRGNFNASLQQDAAMIALVDAIAGIMFFTTPCVIEYVTPGMLNSCARLAAFW